MHLQHTCFYEIILQSFKQQTISSRIKVLVIYILLSENRSGHLRQAANSLLLARERSPDVNNKPISFSYLEQGYCWNIIIFNLKAEILIPVILSVPD